MVKFIEESSRKNKTKTVCIETLEVPKQENNMFMFGKNRHNEATCMVSHEDLKKIPEICEKKPLKSQRKYQDEKIPYNKSKSKIYKKNEHKSCKSQIYENPSKKNQEKDIRKPLFHEYNIKRDKSRTGKPKVNNQNCQQNKNNNIYASAHYFNTGPAKQNTLYKKQTIYAPTKNYLFEKGQN